MTRDIAALFHMIWGDVRDQAPLVDPTPRLNGGFGEQVLVYSDVQPISWALRGQDRRTTVDILTSRGKHIGPLAAPILPNRTLLPSEGTKLRTIELRVVFQ